jgi:hypothetical protein
MAMALMQIFRLCDVSFFFLVMLMHTVRIYRYTYTRWAGLLDYLTL